MEADTGRREFTYESFQVARMVPDSFLHMEGNQHKTDCLLHNPTISFSVLPSGLRYYAEFVSQSRSSGKISMLKAQTQSWFEDQTL